ncbi:MAG: DUF4388 domain-containing protein, partial [Acidimicrobiia bacterium]|nr:DUF4388 domain-containing protein [Acidimicrobiia bacterium]
MALEGSLDTVSLPELLRLLSAGKSGRMVVDGERGPGALEVRHGRVVAAETERTGRIGDDRSPALAEGLFELLRSETGTFRFDPLEADESADEGAAAGTSPLAAVEELVDEATDLLARWRAVEVVVPSLLVAVDVAEAPPDGEATLDRARWPVLIAAARSATVADVGERLGLDEVRVSYAVRDLVDAGLVTIGPEREPEPVALAADPGVEPFVQEVPPAEAYEAAVAYDTAGSYERAEALNETYE